MQVHSSIFITARTASSRLPAKVIKDVFDGVLAIEFLIRRVKRSKLAASIILCTTKSKEDDILCQIATQEGIPFFRGSTEDKLSRWRDAAQAFDVDYFVTADGDDLLVDPFLIDLGIEALETGRYDIVTAPDAPCGSFTYGINVEALNEICGRKKTKETEMMWVFFDLLENPRKGQLKVSTKISRPDVRLTLDYEEDLTFFREVLRIINGNVAVSTEQVMEILDANPEISQINAFRQADYLSNQAKIIGNGLRKVTNA